MSDIVIRNMEMPSGCHDCLLCNRGDELSDDWYCEALHGERLNASNKTGIKRADCPLVELPPHGRLIDADQLKHKTQSWTIGRRDDFYSLVINANATIKEILDSAPTVLEASK